MTHSYWIVQPVSFSRWLDFGASGSTSLDHAPGHFNDRPDEPRTQRPRKIWVVVMRHSPV
jgi:hypothetical protein